MKPPPPSPHINASGVDGSDEVEVCFFLFQRLSRI